MLGSVVAAWSRVGRTRRKTSGPGPLTQEAKAQGPQPLLLLLESGSPTKANGPLRSQPANDTPALTRPPKSQLFGDGMPTSHSPAS